MFKKINTNDFYIIPFTNEVDVSLSGAYDQNSREDEFDRIYIDPILFNNNVLEYKDTNDKSKYQRVEYFSPNIGDSKNLYKRDTELYYNAVGGYKIYRYIQGTDEAYNSILQLLESKRHNPAYNMYDNNAVIQWDSNKFDVIDIPNLLIGDEIKSGSLRYVYTYGGETHTLTDNGFGSINHSGTSSGDTGQYGFILYEYGLLIFPHVDLENYSSYTNYYDPSDSIILDSGTLEYKSRFTTYTQIINIGIKAGEFNLSNNNTMYLNSSSLFDDFNIIDTVNLYDDEYNLLGRTKLSSPIMNNGKNNILIRIKHDI